MTPTEFPEQTVVYQKPENMTDEECLPLPVYDNGNLKISCWKATPADKLQFLFEGKMWLHVYANFLPPTAVTPLHPFVEETAEDAGLRLNNFLQRKANQFITDNFPEMNEETKDFLAQALQVFVLNLAGLYTAEQESRMK